ncbi:MAG: AraC family transcriptional regulator [Chroococcidiopsidaceae cyanobacterium CP_BM_ER_R8_30]|nr:AraC family transcriptional regulator [Chroococcidiopsidaceae cyanobacterium CP_BM_ER_R8_30]
MKTRIAGRADKAAALDNRFVADIALQVGFSSHSHLTQQFKRITGITPRQVRSSVLEFDKSS